MSLKQNIRKALRPGLGVTALGGVFGAGIVLGVLRPRHPENVWQICQWCRPISSFLGFKFTIEGEEFLTQEDGPHMFVSNHQNNFDIFAAAPVIRKGTVSVGKREILLMPIFGLMFWLSGNILINRGNISKAKKALDKGLERIRKKGMHLWVLPEGTRSRGRGLLPFKKGAFHMAIQGKMPIVPICFGQYHGKINFGEEVSTHIHIKILPPLIHGQRPEDAGELTKHCQRLMAESIAELDNRS